MPAFTVKAKNKATGKVCDMSVDGQPDLKAAHDHVRKLPTSPGAPQGWDVVIEAPATEPQPGAVITDKTTGEMVAAPPDSIEGKPIDGELPASEPADEHAEAPATEPQPGA